MTEVGDLGLPSLHEFTAEESWQAIDFISDLHLTPESPKAFEAWKRYLLGTRADAVFILGDLFEVWVGDDARHEGFEAQCTEVLMEAAARLRLAFMPGNRDFLVGTDLLQATGMLALQDPTRLVAWEQPVLLTHGDRLCLADVDYQAFRAQVRRDDWQERFLGQALALRREQARQMRDASQSHQQTRLQAGRGHDSDIDVATAVAWLHQAGCRTLVHGHTHRPGTEVMAPGYTRHVLSDWDLDAERPRAEALRLTRDGFVRLPLWRAA